MELRSIKGVDFSEKKVLIRVDFNVEIDAVGEIAEHFKLEVAKETIDTILSFPGVKVALLTHYGRPDGRRDPAFSVERILKHVERAIGRKVVFISECYGTSVKAALDAFEPGTVVLLENVRFFEGEESNDPAFAAALADPFDIYVNEAFSASHRAHASIVGVPSIIPGYAGLRTLEEVAKLDAVRFAPDRPAIAVIGGAKIETKLPLIRALEKSYDCVLVGGRIANEAIDQGIVFSDKVLLPRDFESSGQRFDIGPDTVAFFISIIKIAKTIIWNGPMGKFEEKPYDIGTEAVLHAMLESQAFVVIGGGESLAIVEREGLLQRIGFVSSGGGAMLEYMSGASLPGLEAIKI